MISKRPKLENFSSLIVTFLIISFLFIGGCNAFKKDSALKRDRPLQAEEKRKKNVKEGRGVGIGTVLGRGNKTNYEFSTSNPMWRASLEILDFLPLATVDYSGGIIITDWYAEDSSKQDSIKISLRSFCSSSHCSTKTDFIPSKFIFLRDLKDSFSIIVFIYII